jgi:hypothetical protein
VHYAVNCASLGCPNLQPAAFTAENTENLLERGAKEYVNHPRGVAVKIGSCASRASMCGSAKTSAATPMI